MDDPHDEAASPQESLQEWREWILNWVLNGLAFFGGFAVIGGVKLRLYDGRLDYVALYLLGYGAILLAALAHRLGFVPRALILLGVLYVVAVSGYPLYGLATAGSLYLSEVLESTCFELGFRDDSCAHDNSHDTIVIIDQKGRAWSL